MTGDLQRFIRIAETQSNRLEQARGIDWLAGHPDAQGSLVQDPDICPKCGGSFEATGGKPTSGEYICQKCYVETLYAHTAGDGSGKPVRQGLVFGSDVAKLEFPPCQHAQFTAMRGKPETARCDDCGQQPDPSDYSRVRIRYVETIDEML